MTFTAETYRDAARERVKVARDLYERRHYVMAHYVAGVAVECVLRAYRFRRNPELDARHDLHVLYRDSGFDVAVGTQNAFRAAGLLGTIAFQWNNAHRYRSEKQFERYLKRIGADRRIKGSFVKENARRVVEAADEFAGMGVRSWPTS